MKNYFELVIVIPTYNEADRLSKRKYLKFLETHDDVLLCFVNDGSIDDTKKHLQQIKLSAISNVKIIEHKQNRGKAAAVLTGVQFCNTNINYNKIAYLDADLSTSLEECYDLSKNLDAKTAFVFGSRIRKLDSFIKRKSHRFLIGRFIATIISKQLQLNVYDTQCGCKLFSKQLAAQIFQSKFVSTWLFDVEIFHRIQNQFGKMGLIRISKEIPLRSWIDKNHSKVSYTYFFKMWFELLLIKKKYTLKEIQPTKDILGETIIQST